MVRGGPEPAPTKARAHRSVGSTQIPSSLPKRGSRSWPRGAPSRVSTCTRLPPSSATSSCSPHSVTPRGSMNCPGAAPYLPRGRRRTPPQLRGCSVSDTHAAGVAAELSVPVPGVCLNGGGCPGLGAEQLWSQRPCPSQPSTASQPMHGHPPTARQKVPPCVNLHTRWLPESATYRCSASTARPEGRSS